MSGFRFQMEDDKIKIVDDLQPVGAGKQELPYMKMEDTQYFAKLLEDVDEEMLPPDEQKERKIMRLLLKIKNGTPPMRKVRVHFFFTFVECQRWFQIRSNLLA